MLSYMDTCKVVPSSRNIIDELLSEGNESATSEGVFIGLWVVVLALIYGAYRWAFAKKSMKSS